MSFYSRRQVAERLLIPEQTLRFWEREDLLPAFSPDDSDSYISKAKLIRAARGGGLRMDELREAKQMGGTAAIWAEGKTIHVELKGDDEEVLRRTFNKLEDFAEARGLKRGKVEGLAARFLAERAARRGKDGDVILAGKGVPAVPGMARLREHFPDAPASMFTDPATRRLLEKQIELREGGTRRMVDGHDAA